MSELRDRSFAAAHRRTLVLVALVCAGVVAALAGLVVAQWSPLLRLDHAIGRPAEAFTLRHGGLTRGLLWVETAFGTLGTAVYVAVLVVTVWRRGDGRLARWLVLVTVTTAASTTALKVLVHRDRPVWVDPVQTLTTFSYPSGHASAIVAGAAAVIAVVLSFQVSRAARRGCLVGAFLLVLLVGADRVMLGVHNLSDVAGGYALGLLCVAVTTLLYPPSLFRRGLAVRSCAGCSSQSALHDDNTLCRQHRPTHAQQGS